MMTPHQKAIRERQLDPNDDLYWKSRGWDSKPWDWQNRLSRGDVIAPRIRFPAMGTPSVAPYHLDVKPTRIFGVFESNPDHLAYWQARGWDEMPDRSEKMNPNNDAYWVLKGYEERPDDWRNRV